MIGRIENALGKSAVGNLERLCSIRPDRTNPSDEPPVPDYVVEVGFSGPFSGRLEVGVRGGVLEDAVKNITSIETSGELVRDVLAEIASLV